MKRYINVFFLIFLTISIAFGSGPKGNSLARAKNDHSGNKIRTTFYNYGLVGRWTSEPEDIGDAVVFLLSEKSNYITGQIISVDGGSSLN